MWHREREILVGKTEKNNNVTEDSADEVKDRDHTAGTVFGRLGVSGWSQP